jgi:Ca-activated chloride channel homolog
VIAAINFSHPHFAEARWLWLAVLGPILLFGLQRYSAWKRERQLRQIVAAEFVPDLTRSHSPIRREIKNLMLVAAVAAIGLALARPQWGEQAQSSRLLGEDIVFVLDCSRSMLATDVAPSRLQRAKLAILDFAQHQSHGRLGLVAFAGQAFLQCPLTYDYAAFQDALTAADDKVIPVQGTDVGRALDEAFHSLDKNQRRKVLVLVTDGEDLEKGGLHMAEELGKEGVIIYAIGVGTAPGSEIQTINPQGKPETLRDSKGEVVVSHLDETTLQGIAQATHGAYYPLGPVGEGLARVRVHLEGLDGAASSAAVRKLGVDRFHLPLAVGLCILVIESLVSTRRPRDGAARAEATRRQ